MQMMVPTGSYTRKLRAGKLPTSWEMEAGRAALASLQARLASWTSWEAGKLQPMSWKAAYNILASYELGRARWKTKEAAYSTTRAGRAA